jgi:predicted RNase H-like nuclease (RuvC/YqgF family)
MYEEFTQQQLVSGLKSLKLENADLLNTIKKLKKELKDLKGQCSSFEGDRLDKKTVARRFNVN